VLFVAGTMAILIEGLICAVLIVPVFTLLGGVAGLITGAVCRRIGSAQHMLIGVAVLPLVLAPLELGVSLPHRVGVVERTVLVGAHAPDVWSRIVNTGPIAAERVGGAWIFRIGVPVPRAGITRETPQGFVRRVTMAKNVYFDELITDWQPPHRLRWVYRFYEDSFPPTALDDHVRLGGEYFDMLDTSYSLAETDAGTQVKVRMTYRVSTRFNWYADPLARFLLGNMAEGNLRYYASPADSPEG